MARLERGADNITDWQSGTGMYTIASFSLVRPSMTILSRNQTKRCAIRRILLNNSRSKITMGSYPFSRQDIHNGGRIRRWTGDGQKVVNSVSIGIPLLIGMFSIPYHRCLLKD